MNKKDYLPEKNLNKFNQKKVNIIVPFHIPKIVFLHKLLKSFELNKPYVDLYLVFTNQKEYYFTKKKINLKGVKIIILPSNIIKSLLSKKNIYPIFTKKKINLCSKDYSKKIKNYFKNKKISFDYFLLGMGNDGHIASIFPGDRNFFDKFISLPVARNDFKRITLSLNVINNSKKIILWLNKKSKSEKFKRLKIQGKKIPFNNLNKKKTTVYKIV